MKFTYKIKWRLKNLLGPHQGMLGFVQWMITKIVTKKAAACQFALVDTHNVI